MLVQCIEKGEGGSRVSCSQIVEAFSDMEGAPGSSFLLCWWVTEMEGDSLFLYELSACAAVKSNKGFHKGVAIVSKVKR